MPRPFLSDKTSAVASSAQKGGLTVSVANQTPATVVVGRIESAVQAALVEVGRPTVEVSVAIVDDATIHELNRRYLNHDYPTDVLSFVLTDLPDRLEGEIIVSCDTARRMAESAGWSAADELLLYVVHGALHLAGYEDCAPRQAEAMLAAEAAVLDRLGVNRSPSDSRWSGDLRELAAEASLL